MCVLFPLAPSVKFHSTGAKAFTTGCVYPHDQLGLTLRAIQSNVNRLLHDNIRFNIKEKVIIVPPDFQQEGCLLLQCPLQVSSGQQRSAI